MAAKKGSKKGGGKKAAPKAAKPEVNIPALVGSFKGTGKGAWQKYCKAQRKGELGRSLGLNETGLSIAVDGSAEQNASSVNKLLTQFNVVSGRWEATAAYGRQHYNDDGLMHREGVSRLSNDACGKIVVQTLEELFQRGALAGKGVVVTNAKRDPSHANQLIKVILGWMGDRPAEIKAASKMQSYALVEQETGIKLLTKDEKAAASA